MSKSVRLKSLRMDGGTQQRVRMDEQTIERYAEWFRDHPDVDMDPIEVVKDDQGELWPWDGFQRIEAARRAGREEITANIERGTQRDAQLKSFGANYRHGLPRREEDIRQAVDTMLADPEWSKWSNRRIANACNVAEVTVRRHREKLSVPTGAPPGAPGRKVEGADGRKYPANRPNSAVSNDFSEEDIADAEEVAKQDTGAGTSFDLDSGKPIPIRSSNGEVKDLPVVDDDGKPVPKRLIPIFQAGAAFKEAANACERAANALERLEATGAHQALDDIAKQNKAERRVYSTLFRTAAKRYKALRPAMACAACKGVPASKDNEDCGACGGKGWLTVDEVAHVRR